MTDVADWFAEQDRIGAARTATVLGADPRSPDELADHAKIGAQLGLPPIVVGSDPAAYKARVEQKSLVDALAEAPKTAAWLANRDNGGIAKDDVENLSSWEKGLKDFGDIGETVVNNPATRGIAKGVVSGAGNLVGQGAMQSAIQAADIGLTKEEMVAKEIAAIPVDLRNDTSMIAAAQEAALIKFDAIMGMGEDEKTAMLKGAADRLTSARALLVKASKIAGSATGQAFMDGPWEKADKSIMGAIGAMAEDPVGALAFLGDTVAQSLGAMAPAIVATAATRSPAVGAAVMGGTSFAMSSSSEAMSFLEKRGVKLDTPEDVAALLSNQALMQEAQQYGLSKGIIIGALDAVSGGIAGKALSSSQIGDMVLQTLSQASLGAGGEFLAQAAVDGELDWKQIIVEGLAEFATAPIEMASMGRGWLKSSAEKAARAKTTVGKIERIDELAAASKVKARSPEKMADFLDKVVDGKTFYVPADDLSQLFQAKDFGPTDWGIDPATFEEVLAAGGDIAVPVATYASKITGTENAGWFKDNAKTVIGEMSAVEARRFNEEVRATLDAQMAASDADRMAMLEMRASDVQVKDQIYSMLRSAGQTRDVADTNARLTSAAIRTMAQRSGQDPLDMAKRFGLEIKGPQTEQARRRGDLDIALNTLRKAGSGKTGSSLTEFVIAKGGLQDIGGELAAMDAPAKLIAESAADVVSRKSQPTMIGLPSLGKGVGLDEMARAAVEAGYFPDGVNEADLTATLIAAIQEEIAGVKRFIPGQEGDVDLQNLAAELDRRGIDLAASNDEIAAALEQSTDGQEYSQSGMLRTDTPAFQAWFGDSKVVDADGKPLVVYHGTSADFEAFDPAKIGSKFGDDKVGFFFTNNTIDDMASGYASHASGGEGGNVMAAYVSLQNPFTLADYAYWMGYDGFSDEIARDILDGRGIVGWWDVNKKYILSDEQFTGNENGPYDGVFIQDPDFVTKTGPENLVMALRPTQIKSVNNRGTWDANDPRILFQGDKPQSDPLYVVHNLSAEKLRHAVNLGGLAAPSLAIARGDIGFDNFGEISLIGDPKMADPKGKGVRAFNADVYSPRQPRAMFKVNAKVRKVMMAALQPFADKIGVDLDQYLDDRGIEKDGLAGIEAQTAAKMAYLAESGTTVEPVLRAPQPAPDAIEEFSGITATMPYDVRRADGFEAAALEYANNFLARVSPSLKDKTKEVWFAADGGLSDTGRDRIARVVADRNAKIASHKATPSRDVDRYETGKAVDAALAGKEAEFSAWVSDKFGDVVGGAFFEDANGKRRDYVMSNIVKEMTKTVRNGEKWNYGAGNVRAAAAKEFKSLAEIKDARGDIVSDADFDKVRTEVSERLFGLADRAKPYFRNGDSFGFTDTFIEYLMDTAKGPRAMAEWAGSMSAPMPADLMAEAAGFLTSLKGLPTEYFEIKMQRAVGLEEFTAAVVPINASTATIQALKDAGLRVVTYDRSVEGARTEALQQVGAQTFFQPAYHGTPHLFDKFTTDKIGTGTGEQAFGWGLYFAGRKEIAAHYRDSLAGMRNAKVDRALASHNGDVSKAIAGVKAEIDRLMALPNSGGDAALLARKVSTQRETLQALEDAKAADRGNGRLFKVDIPEDADLMAWDAPLSKQPRKVREKLQPLIDEVVASRMNESDRKDIIKGKATGALFYRRLSQHLATKNKTGAISDNASASKALLDAGIPGHRLLDGPSANAGFLERKHYNYVIYDEDAVQVLEFNQQNRASITLPSGGIDGGLSVISLFENSDLSSFQHEIGHYMLEVFNVLASEQSAPQDMRDDLAAIQKYLGMEAGAKPTVEQHETFARTWEAYLMEGKSPSLELADAFARFKAWMLRIYQTVSGLKVKISPEIRGVLDRMIATDAEISAARDEQAMKPLFTDEVAAGMSPAAFKTYQRMARRATEQAEQSLMEKTMAVERRKVEAWWKAEYKQVLGEVTKSINSQRHYRLTEMLANQVWLSDTPREVPDIQLDRKALVDTFGAGVLAELGRDKLGGKRAIYKDGGARLMEVADLFGFANPQEMVETLQNAGKRKDAIRAETDRIMRDRYGDPLTDGSIESAALEAIHSEQQAMTVASEVRHLASRAGVPTRNLTAQVFRQRARLMFGRMAVSEAGNPNAFLAAGRKAAKRAEDAFARVASGGDSKDALTAAARHKEQQLLNHYLYLESRDFAKELESGREKMRGYAKGSVRQKLEGGYIEQIDALLDAYDFRVRSKGQVARAESLTAFVQRMTDAGRAGELAIDPRIIARAAKVHYSRLSVDELRGLFDTIANIDHLGRFKQKLIDAQEQRDHDAVVGGVIAQFDANVKPNPPSRTPDAGERAGKRGRDYLNSILNADTLLREIDGFKDLGPSWMAMKAKIDQGMFRLTERRKAMGQAFDGIYSVYSLAEKRDMSMKRQNTALGIPMSKWDLIALALNTGNTDNFERLTNPKSPGHFDAAGIQSALSELTERDWSAVQGTWDYINSFWPEIAAKEKRQTGVAPQKVEAKLMVDAPANVTGGYYPIRYDGRLSGLTQDFSQKELADSLMGGMFGKAQTRNGHVEARTSTTKQPILLDLAVGHQHVEQVLYDLEIGEAVAGSWKILHDPRIRSAFINSGKQSDWDALEIWQQDVASGDRASAGGVQSMMRALRSGFTFSRLAFNVSTALIQPSGLVQSAVVIGKAAVAKGTISYMQNPARWVREVTQVSSLMRERKLTFERDINNAVGDLALSQDGTSWVSKSANWVSPVLGKATVGTSMRWQKFQRDILIPASFTMMQSVQFYTVDMPTWVSAYQKELGASKDESKARAYADTITKRAQGSGLISDRGMLERGTLNRNSRQQELPKLLTALGSYMFAKGNVAYEQVMKTDFKDPAQVMSLAVDIALLFTLEAVLYSAVKGGLPGEDDDEPADWAAWLAKQTLFSGMSTLPGFRELSGAMQGYGGGGVFGSSIEVIARPFIQAGQGEADKSAVKAFVDAAGITLHLPSAQIKSVIEGIFEADMSVRKDPSIGTALMGGNGKGRSLADMLFGD